MEDTAAYTYKNDRDAAELCERLAGVGRAEAKRAIETAGRLEALPLTDAAVRAGKLSARASELIASAAADDPAVERQLLQAAGRGMAAVGRAA
ncbi:MAG: hypothetical protein ACXVKA_15675 [Acidimicrobiia bacterium]